MLEKLKSFLAEDAYFYTLLLLLVAFASFGLGRQSVLSQDNMPEMQSAQVVLPAPIVPNREVETGENKVSTAVIASKSGTKYHLPTCPGAKQIKESNMITFDSIAAAEAAGYTPAANCAF